MMVPEGAQPNGLLRVFAQLEATSDDANAADEEPQKVAAGELPAVVRWIVLSMELVLAFGAGMVMSWAGTFARSITTSLLRAFGMVDAAMLCGSMGECVAFAYGTLSFLGWFFGMPRSIVFGRIGGFVLSRSSVIVVVASLVFHCCAFGLLAWTTPSERSSLTTTPSSLLNAVIWAPVKEEMFFRGIVFVVLCNRSARPAKSVKRISSSAIGSGLLFSLVHLANIRRAASKDQHALDTSSSYVALQCASAAIIGMFLSIRFARSGSLLECVILHAINNAFAQLLLGGNLVSLDTVYTRLLLTVTGTWASYICASWFTLRQHANHKCKLK